MRARALELLRSLSEADGIPGHEDEVREVFRRELAGVGELAEDQLGSVVCKVTGEGDRPRIMLDAHLDEIGFLVQAVTPGGFLRFIPLGGWWGHVLLGQRVRIQTAKGKIGGVVSSTPPHFLKPEERKKVLEPREMYIDVGARNAEAVESLGISPGSPVTPESSFCELSTPGILAGKAFDNRAGCALVIQVLQELGAHPNVVLGVGSVQEEVGHRGATTSVTLAEPDVALVLEGTPADDTPGLDSERAQGRLGRGVQIRVSDPTMIGHPGLRALLEETARGEGIPYQLAVRHSGGTDGAAIHKHAAGVPAVVLGVPVRYVHSHVSILCLEDYLAALGLVLAFLRRFDRSAWEGLRS